MRGKIAVRWKVVLVVVSLVHLWLGRFLTVRALPTNNGDDGLYVRLAASLLAGDWLGPYTGLTLIKGPGYSLFMAASNVLGLPLLLSQHLLHILSCAVFVAAIRPLVARDGVLVALYTLLLFNPLAWADGLANHAIREQVYVPLTLLTLGCAIGLLVRRDASVARLAVWSVGTGLALTAFWLTREEGLWLLPSLLLLLGATAFFIVRAHLLHWRTRPARLAARLALCALPFALLAGGLVTVSTINGARYGVYEVVELQQEDFLAAYGALARVEPARRVQYVPVPKAIRQELYRVSPAFAELRPTLEEKGVFEDQTCAYLPQTCGEIAGGWWIWKLRDAVVQAGYGTPATQFAYYARLAREVNGACDARTVACGPRNDSLTPPIHPEDVPAMLAAMGREFEYAYTFRNVNVKNTPSIGTEELFVPFRWVTRERLAPTQEATQAALPAGTRGQPQLRIFGWAFNPVGELDFRVYTADGKRAQATFVPLPADNSPDLFAAYKMRTGKEYAPANNSRFEIHTTCTAACSIAAVGSGKELGRFPLDRESPVVTNPDLWFHIDAPAPLPPPPDESTLTPPLTGVDRFKQWAMNGVVAVYRLGFPPLIVLGTLAYAATVLAALVRRRATLLLLINTAVLGAIVVRFGLLAILNAVSFGANIATNIRYLAPIYPLILIVTVLAIIDARQQYRRRGRAGATATTAPTRELKPVAVGD